MTFVSQVACLQEEIEILGNQIATKLTADLASYGNSEETNNSNSNTNTNSNNNSSNAGSLLFSQHHAVKSQHYPNQQEIQLSQNQNSTGNNFNQVLDGQMGDQLLKPSYGLGWEEENVVFHSLTDPLERLSEGIEQENLRNNPWLDESPNVENCIGPMWG